MKLKDILEQVNRESPYGKIRWANPADDSDNKNLLHFFEESPITGNEFSIGYKRSPDFFAFLKDQAESFFVFIYEDLKNNIKGVATISLRTGYVNQKEVKIGMLSDLRISFDRHLIKTWRNALALITKNMSLIEEFEGCQFLYAAIIDENKIINSAFEQRKNQSYIAKPIDHYEMINIFQRLPFISTPQLSGVRIYKTLFNKDIAQFLNKENKKYTFGYTPDEWDRRMNNWSHFNSPNFWVAESSEKEIIGCTALWSPSEHKTIVVNKSSRLLKLFFNIAAPFMLKKPKEHHPLDILYLTHLYISQELDSKIRQNIFLMILDQIFQSGEVKNYHFLSFSDFSSHPLFPNSMPWIVQRMPMSLKQVFAFDGGTGDTQKMSPPIAFEIALV